MNAPAKILVVDDALSYRILLRAQLRSLGYEVAEAADGIEALDILSKEPIQAVISDILMPRMDGYRLSQEIRSREATRHLPILVFTSTYVSAEDQQLALRAGADAYLVKPAPLPKLQEAIQQLLSRGRLANAPPAAAQETMMREYNAVLIQKLEDKSRETAAQNERLARLNTELEQSRATLEATLANANDAIVTLDQRGQIVFANAAVERLFGVAPTAAIGSPLTALITEGLSGISLAGADGALRVHTARSLISSVHRPDGQLITLESVASSQGSGGARLTTVIFRDVTERQRTDRETRLLSEQLRALAIRLEAIREEERTRIAREIHDILAQELTSLKIDLLWAVKRAPHALDDSARHDLALRLQQALAKTDSSITTVQRIATELRPAILDSLGLGAAVEWLAEDFSRRTGIVCVARTPGEEFPDPGRERATALFRILQESLTNVARHARATHVQIELATRDGFIDLDVRDNGCGLTPAQVADPLSIGLIGMRERAQAHGGTLRIANSSPSGTLVAVRLPLPASPA